MNRENQGMIPLAPIEVSEVEMFQRKIRKLESQLRRYRKEAKRRAPTNQQTGKHATREALVQSVLVAVTTGSSVQQTAAKEGISTTIVYNILKPYGGAVALRKRKA